MTFEIDEKLAQSLLNYLADRPYKEVMMMIQDLMKLKPLEGNKNEVSSNNQSVLE